MYHAHGKLPTISLVIQMATEYAAALGMTTLDAAPIRTAMRRRVPVPMIFESNGYRLWVDRYYIAFQHMGTDKQPVLYIYISRTHIVEEVTAYLRARRRGVKGSLDAATRAQFAAAWKALDGSRLGYATRELKPTSGQQPPLDSGTPWRCGHPLNKETAPAVKQERS